MVIYIESVFVFNVLVDYLLLFGAARLAGRTVARRRLLLGAAVGGIVFCVLTLISLMINRGGLTQNTLFRFVILMLSSVIGGILGVNRKSQHKYI